MTFIQIKANTNKLRAWQETDVWRFRWNILLSCKERMNATKLKIVTKIYEFHKVFASLAPCAMRIHGKPGKQKSLCNPSLSQKRSKRRE